MEIPSELRLLLLRTAQTAIGNGKPGEQAASHQACQPFAPRSRGFSIHPIPGSSNVSGTSIYIDGQYYEKSQAKVSVFDHGLLYGDGVFEGIRAYQGCIFRLRQHLDRLYASAKYILMEIPISMEEMTEVVKESCRRNQLRDAYIRLVVTRGVSDLGLSPWKCPKPTIICIAAEIQLYSEELYKTGLQLITATTQRSGAQVIHPRVKSLNYMNNILAKIEAITTGCPEALMVNQEGYVVEATGDNVFVVKNGVLTTPPTWMGALCGITRDAVVEIAKGKRPRGSRGANHAI